jgi:hypothetical protein
MAYSGTGLSRITQTIEGGFGLYVLYTTDSIAAVLGANYITDLNRGLAAGDIVFALCGATNPSGQIWQGGDMVITFVSAVSATGVTLSPSGGSSQRTKYTTAALTAGTLTAAQIAGADTVYLSNSGATPGAQTLPAASVLFAAQPGAQTGDSYVLRIINTGAGTLTVTDDVGATITLSGHVAITTNTFVDYLITFTSPTTATMTSIGSGVSP